MQDERMKALAKDFLGMSEPDMAKVTPEQELQYRNTMENMAKFRLVAEVKKARYCAAGLQVGQKLVFDGVQIDKNASDCPLCVGAISPLDRALTVYLDRCAHNRDVAALIEAVYCIDPGFEAGTSSPWQASPNVIAGTDREPTHSGTWFKSMRRIWPPPFR